MRGFQRIRRLLSRGSGMTLLEAVLAMALLAMLVAVCGGLIVSSMRAAADGARTAEAAAAGSAVADYVAGELRYATGISVDGSGPCSLRVSENRLERLKDGVYTTVYDFSDFPDAVLTLTVMSLEENRAQLRVSVTGGSGERVFDKDFGITLLNSPDTGISGGLPARNAEIFYSVE